MASAPDFDGFEVAWRDFLSSLEKAWIKLERVCRQRPGFVTWQARFKLLRETDPLLQYLYHARHVDQHTVKEMLDLVPGKREVRIDGPGLVAIDHLVIEHGRVLSYSGNRPLKETITPARAELIMIENRGKRCEPPTEHLGAVVADRSPLGVAIAGLRFYKSVVGEAELKYFGGTR